MVNRCEPGAPHRMDKSSREFFSGVTSDPMRGSLCTPEPGSLPPPVMTQIPGVTSDPPIYISALGHREGPTRHLVHGRDAPRDSEHVPHAESPPPPAASKEKEDERSAR